MFKSKVKVLLLLVGLMMGLTSYAAQACKIDFKVVKGEKKEYSVGDEITVQVDVIYTHRVCPEGIDATDFKMQGMKVTGATKWKTNDQRSFTRQMKIKIIDTKAGDTKMTVTRTCNKQGGFGELILPMKK